LQREGVSSVCLVDAAANRGDPRVGETLPPAICVILKELGLWGRFRNDGHEPCLGSCACWGNDTLGYNDFLLSPYGRGWHLDRRQFDAFLLSNAVSKGTHLCVGRVIGCSTNTQQFFQLRLRENNGVHSTLSARFVVDATGSRSVFARSVGAQRRFLDRLIFLYGFFDTSDGSSSLQLTLLEAAEEGWWYAAPLPRQRLAVAFATDPEVIRHESLAYEDKWFTGLLRTRHIAPRLDGCRLLRGSLITRAAPSFLLDQVAGARWLAVGDAAASYDPLSSQGIYKALQDGLRAASALTLALSSDADLNLDYQTSVFAGFEDYRYNRNHFYQVEQRWAKSSFWRRRHTRTKLQSPRRSS
jgi:flavin-dependent dehydrogenase